eukprot:CAMPEP_0198329868 /NCGR_PEP_ID=MMETSP1450-20131203/16512_1 /TAXON_ID=753684 ORGANISM="Madagascaria erythrocladiodes, Strain CCMP3234" /NCGR_SAMPLE_ID=MMETSP1450 /ASSEMBLY_ACC=CAM_ASM_001115 /LENGTH=678 /DNA_ID=CAMNT_0044034123 /DNA_START=296 /DNA_END=2332 /DNA_ORIENTATION=-
MRPLVRIFFLGAAAVAAAPLAAASGGGGGEGPGSHLLVAVRDELPHVRELGAHVRVVEVSVDVPSFDGAAHGEYRGASMCFDVFALRGAPVPQWTPARIGEDEFGMHGDAAVGHVLTGLPASERRKRSDVGPSAGGDGGGHGGNYTHSPHASASITCFELRAATKRHFAEFAVDDGGDDVLGVRLMVWTRNVTHGTGVAFTATVHALGGGARAQVWLALVLLLVTYGFIVADVVHHTLVAVVASFVALLMLTAFGKQPTLAMVIAQLEPGTLALLFGMMLLVGIMADTGLFEWAAVRVFELSRGSVRALFVVLCVVTAVLSAFLDNVTTILLLVPVTISLCKVLDLDPVPLLMGEVLLSKLGGAATLVGDPPNIIIGSQLSAHINFVSFIVNMTPGVLVVFVPTLLHLLFVYRADVRGVRDLDTADLRRNHPIKDGVLAVKCGVVGALVLFAFFLQPVHGVDPAWAALAGGFALLLLSSPHDVEYPLRHIEYDSLVFFAALFVLIESLAEMGLIRLIGRGFVAFVLLAPASGQLAFALTLLLWLSAISSAFIDNIPYTATMVPVIIEMSRDPTLALPIAPLAWALAWGADIGGNGTLIGSSANIVVASLAHQAGYSITFRSFFKVGFPNMLISTLFANIYLLVVYVAIGEGIPGAVGHSLYAYEHGIVDGEAGGGGMQ